MVGTVGILYWGLKGPSEIPTHVSPTQALPGTNDPADPLSGASFQTDASGNSQSGYNPPAVFPATDIFKTEVLESPSFKQLKPYTAVVPGETGREDPFKNF